MSQLNRLQSFRQVLYDEVFTKENDAQFELLDALLASPHRTCFAELTLSPLFRRQWPSAYAALNRGSHDRDALEALLFDQLPTLQPLRLFALDESAWPHPEAATLPDRGFLYSGTRAARRTAHDGRGLTIGHSYSALAFVAETQSSWTLPVSIERVETKDDAITVGLAQIKRFVEGAGRRTTLDVICADARYGNDRFLGALPEGQVAALVCLRRNRVLYFDPTAEQYAGRGRYPRHGAAFRFHDASTWPDPAQRLRVEDARYGQVELRLWHGLHAKADHRVRFSVLGVWAHLERARPDKPLWLAWRAPTEELQTQVPATYLWSWYQARAGIEASFRFRKQALLWTAPCLGTLPGCDNWTALVTLAQWHLWRSRDLVTEVVLPWQRSQGRALTPTRVKQSLAGYFGALGTPAEAPQRRGKAPGWPQGKPRKRRDRHRVVRKGRKRPLKQGQAA